MARLTLTPSAAADNPPKDNSICGSSGLSGETIGAENSLGVIPTPAAGLAAASHNRAGRFEMSRRQVLSASAIPSVAAMGTIFGPTGEASEEFHLWHDWYEGHERAEAAYSRYLAAADALPEGMRPDDDMNALLLEERQRKAYAAARARCANDAERELVDAAFGPILEDIERDHQIRNAAQTDAEVPKLATIADRLTEQADAIGTAIEQLRSPSPIVIAAKLHIAMSLRPSSERREDYPWCLIVAVLRDLADALPDEMADAIRAETDPSKAAA